MSDSGVSFIADLAAAYEPKIGVLGFLRNFNFKAPDVFLIEDSIKTDRSKFITSYLHSDNSIISKMMARLFLKVGNPAFN